mgnify:CR=1 FL=1
MTDASNLALEHLSLLIQANFWLAPVIALVAGLLTSVTPCSLSSVPLVIAYVGGTGRKEPATAFRLPLRRSGRERPFWESSSTWEPAVGGTSLLAVS